MCTYGGVSRCFDGNVTHFGFVVRRRWVYGPTYSVVHVTMMEDFTEGGDISIPFRLPFEMDVPQHRRAGYVLWQGIRVEQSGRVAG